MNKEQIIYMSKLANRIFNTYKIEDIEYKDNIKSGSSHNQLCGECIKLLLNEEKDIIKDIFLFGNTCAFSNASSFILHKYVILSNVNRVDEYITEVSNMLVHNQHSNIISELDCFLDLRDYKRANCILLPWNALRNIYK